jgi:hypothetical protein
MAKNSYPPRYELTGVGRLLGRVLLSGIVGITLYFVLFVMFYTLAPTRWFFQYHAVTVTDIYQSLESGNWVLAMESDLTVFREGELSFKDELECQGPGGATRTILKDHTGAVVHPQPRYTAPWVWELPKGIFGRAGIELPTLCRTEHLISQGLPTGQRRTQVILSKWFEVP